MILLSQEDINNIIRKEYPDANNKVLSDKLGIKEQTLRNRASKLGIKKSEAFMQEYYTRLQKNRKQKQEENYKNYKMSNIERNIIVGSLLGDGTLSKYGRSLNACYRENTGSKQVPYRKWKANILSNLDFKSNTKGAIYSPSHPIYTDLYELFYPNGIKIIPPEGLKMLNHPIGLACLFMDDGSLIASGSTGSNTITICPSIYLYSQSFTKKENIMLLDHIKDIFGITFRLSNISNGHGYHLRLSKNQEIRNLLSIVRPYVDEIPSMKYKADIDSKLEETKIRYSNKYPNNIIKTASKEILNNFYSKEEESKIIEMIHAGFNYKEIARDIGRSYYGLYDKVRRMETKGNI